MGSSGSPRTAVPFLLLATALTALAPKALLAQQWGGTGRGISTETEETQLVVGYAVDAILPVRGGLDGDPVVLDNLDLLLHLNLDALLGLRRTLLRVHGQSNRGGSVGSEVGDLQGISNLEAPREWRLYEAWIEHQIVASQLSVLAGLYDVNSDFDVIPSAGDLLNGSFGLGPEYGLSGEGGPSTYPTTGLAARIKVQLQSSLYGVLGVSDAAPNSPGRGRFSVDREDGALISFEAGYNRVLDVADPASTRALQPDRRGRGQGIGRPQHRRQRRRIGRGQLIEEVSTKVAVGGWTYTRKFRSWIPDGSPERSWGLYILGERLLHQRQDGSGLLSGFARVGTAADAVNRLDLHLGGGVAYRGALPGRPDDVAVLGVAHGRNGSPFLGAQREAGMFLERSETVLELTYRTQIGGSFVLQPDLQWVINPGMDPGLSNALVFGLRSHLLLEFPGSS